MTSLVTAQSHGTIHWLSIFLMIRRHSQQAYAQTYLGYEGHQVAKQHSFISSLSSSSHSKPGHYLFTFYHLKSATRYLSSHTQQHTRMHTSLIFTYPKPTPTHACMQNLQAEFLIKDRILLFDSPGLFFGLLCGIGHEVELVVVRNRVTCLIHLVYTFKNKFWACSVYTFS